MQRIALYDMDKTITARPTYSAFLVHAALRLAPWRLLLAPLSALAGLAYMLKLVSRTRLKEINLALLLGQPSLARLEPVIRDYARKVVTGNILPGALDQIGRDRASCHRIVIATASFALYAKAIAEELGIADVIATRLEEAKGGRLSNRVAGGNCYGETKLDMITEWLADNGIDRQSCSITAYSDHVSDAPMLEFADVAVAANPHDPLRQLAASRGWAIADWRVG